MPLELMIYLIVIPTFYGVVYTILSLFEQMSRIPTIIATILCLLFSIWLVLALHETPKIVNETEVPVYRNNYGKYFTSYIHLNGEETLTFVDEKHVKDRKTIIVQYKAFYYGIDLSSLESLKPKTKKPY